MRKSTAAMAIGLGTILLAACSPDRRTGDLPAPSIPPETIQAEEDTGAGHQYDSLSRQEKLKKIQREEMTE